MYKGNLAPYPAFKGTVAQSLSPLMLCAWLASLAMLSSN
jgi:hypothetical protein